MAQKPTYLGADNIIEAYDFFTEGAPYWSIWQGRSILGQSFTDDSAAAKKRFVDLIEAADESGNSDLLVIKFHPVLTNGYVTEKTPVVGTMIARVYTADGGLINGQGDPRVNNYYVNKDRAMIEQIKALIDPLTLKIKELEDNQTKEPATGIAGLLEHPLAGQFMQHLMPAIAPAIGKLLGSIIPGSADHGHVPNLAINGIDEPGQNSNPEIPQLELSEADSETVWSALDQLAVMGLDPLSDLPKMAAYAQKNKAMFDMLLSTIRS